MKKGIIKYQIIIVATGLLLLVIKFFAYYLTASNSILTDALESIINVLAGGFALYSLVVAAIPRDHNHPYGHGKIEFLSATIEGSLIFATGVVMIIKATYNFFYPISITALDTGIWLTAVAGAINYLLGHWSERLGRKRHSITMTASGKHLKSDAYSTVGLVAGLLLIIWTGQQWLDNVLAIIFGGIIIVTGYRILRKSIAGIMDEADYELLRKIIGFIGDHRKDDWIDLHNFRIIKFGSVLHIDCHMTLPWYYSVQKGHDIIDRIEQLVRQRFGAQAEMFIHIDPCNASSCLLCAMKDCDKRQQDFAHKVEWRMKNVLKNQQHRL